MSHVSDGSDDFKDLAGVDLNPEILKVVKQARIEAREIIDRLEPRHIDSWPSLIMVLEECLKNAKRNAKIFQSCEI